MVDRTLTGIEGLDKALNGGVPQGNIVLISGGAGTGKSTLCLQFIINGAMKFNEKSLYITTEQNYEELSRQAKCYDWNIKQLESKGLLRVFYLDVVSEKNFLDTLDQELQRFQPQRIVVDSMTTLTDNLTITDFKDKTAFSMVEIMDNVVPTPLSEKLIIKNVLYSLINKLKRDTDATAFLTTELYEDAKGLSADGVSEFICDGVIKLDYIGVGSVEYRSMVIRKMRYTSHEKKPLSYDMGSSGIEFSKEEKLNF